MDLREMLEAVEGAFTPTFDGKCGQSEGGLVATGAAPATRAGVVLLEGGGNAVDAACAAAFAVAVCEPAGSGVGGESKAIVHIDGRTVVVDGGSRAPMLVPATPPSREELAIGYRGTTVPSTVATLGHLHSRWGRRPWAEVLAPAIGIARNGYTLPPLQERLLNNQLANFLSVPTRSAAKYFLKDGVKPYRIGDWFRQPLLADFLETLAEHGPEHFYLGPAAKAIDEDMKANGGFLRAADLADIPWPRECEPLVGHYRGLELRTMPPSSGGRLLLYALALLEQADPAALARPDSRRYRLLAETFRKAMIFGKSYVPDPRTYRFEDDPLRQVLASGNADSGGAPGSPPGHGETTHLSVMDRWGNGVGITQSLNISYGGKAGPPGLGFVYNCYLIDCDLHDPHHPHYLRPGAPTASSAAPTVVLADGRPWMVIGAPGSERIFSALTQFLTDVVDRRLPMSEAVATPRLHAYEDGRVTCEASRMLPEVIAGLRGAGYTIQEVDPWSFFHGAIQAVVQCATRSGFQGVAELRRDGTAMGPAAD